MHWLPRCVLVTMALLLAACTSDPNLRKPLAQTEQVKTPVEKGVVIVGISLRNAKRDSILGLTRPAWIGWIQYDPATQRRTGQHMVVAGEDCLGLSGLTGGVFVRASTACKDIQYRAYALEPGSYALGWSYHAFALHRFAQFRSGQVYFNSRDSLLSSYKFSDDALVPKGGMSFSVGPGEVVYVGNLTIDFAGTNAKASFSPGDVDAARTFVEPMGLADNLTSHPITAVTTDPIRPGQASGAEL